MVCEWVAGLVVWQGVESGFSVLALWVVFEWVEGLGVGLEVEFGFTMVTACVVCVCEWCGLRIELGVEIGCSVAGALVGGWCVRELGCVRVYVFAEWSGCSVVLCLVLVLRCVRVVVYVMGCWVCCCPALLGGE